MQGVYPTERAEKGPKLHNSDVLMNLDQKLEHLPKMGQKQLKALITVFTSVFPNVPEVACHDIDVGEAQPIKQHHYKVNSVKLMYIYLKEVEYMLRNGIIVHM